MEMNFKYQSCRGLQGSGGGWDVRGQRRQFFLTLRGEWWFLSIPQFKGSQAFLPLCSSNCAAGLRRVR